MLDEYCNVAVTGGLGFIGGHLTEALVSMGKRVVILDNASTGKVRGAPTGASVTVTDVRDPAQLAKAMDGTDLVFHTAANASGTVSIEDPRFDFETNARGAFNVFEAAAHAGVKRVFYTSSASVYGRPERFPMDEGHPTRPFVPYGATKLAGELFALSFFESQGLQVVIGRPFCVYGPGENPRLALVEVGRYLRWHLNGRPIPIVGDADRKTRDFVHVSDVVQAFLLIADRAQPGEVFNVGSGEEVSMRQLADVIGDAAGREASIDEISDVTEDTYRLVADIGKLRGLGYSPGVSLAEGVRGLAEELGDRPEMPLGSTIFRLGQRAET